MEKLNEEDYTDPKLGDFLVIWWGLQNYHFLHVCVVLSLFAHFWKQFLSDFDVTPLKSELMASSSRIRSYFATRGPTRHLKMAKICPKIANVSILLPFLGS